MKSIGLILFITFVIVIWIRKNEEEQVTGPIYQKETPTQPIHIIPPIDQEQIETPLPKKDLPRVSHTPAVEQAPRARREELDPYTFPVNADDSIPITSFVVVDDYALAFGDILVAPIEDILDQERRGINPQLPSPALWPNGRVPYQIDPEIDQYDMIKDVLDYFQSVSRVQFFPHSDEENFVVFERGTEHCFAHLGMIGGPQKVVLSPGCQQREIAHEVMHVLGFLHEQNRMDRDEHINIMWDNIAPEFHEQFKKIPSVFSISNNERVSSGTPQLQRALGFSFDSIMLYSPYIFTKDPNLPSMSTKDGSPWRSAQNETSDLLGERDIERLRLIYGR